jgi:hypothetical protein
MGDDVSYRNKTYVASASEVIVKCRLMEAWRENANIYDAPDRYVARDTSKAESIRRSLTERIENAKQVVLRGSPYVRKEGGYGGSFLTHEIKVLMEFDLPVVMANLNGDRNVDQAFAPKPLLDAYYYTGSVSFQPRVIASAPAI